MKFVFSSLKIALKDCDNVFIKYQSKCESQKISHSGSFLNDPLFHKNQAEKASLSGAFFSAYIVSLFSSFHHSIYLNLNIGLYVCLFVCLFRYIYLS